MRSTNRHRFFILAAVLGANIAMAQKVIITGHRGAGGLAPENTLVSVRKALDIGVDRVEIDVQQTSDGVVICLHDKDLDRTTNLRGQVRKQKWADVQKARANKGFEKLFPTEGIPTLDQVLAAVNGKAILVIEIKEGHDTYPDIEKHVLRAVQAAHADSWCVIHTFNDKVIKKLTELHNKLPVQKLMVGVFPFTSMMIDFRVHFASLSDYPTADAFTFGKGFITRSDVQRAHALGKKVHVYTVNNEKDMLRMISFGVDGIITDRPDILKKLIHGK